MTFDPSFAKDIRAFLEFAADLNCVNPTVIYAGDTMATILGVKFDNFKNTSALIPSENSCLFRADATPKDYGL